MADSALGLFFEINADPTRAVRAVSELEQSIGKTMGVVNTAGVKTAQTLDIQATPAVARTGNQLRQAQASAMIFEQQMGVHMPRAINAMLARSELIGPMLQGAFSVAIVALFAENIGKVIKSIADASSALGGYGAGFQATMAGAVKDSNNALTHFRGLTAEAKIATGYLFIAQTQMAITAVQANAALVPMVEAGKQLQITWWQALLGPAGMAIGFGKAVKAMTDTTGATKELGALYNRLNQQISAMGALQDELHKNQGKSAKAAAKDAEEAGQKMVAAIRSYTDVSRSLQVQLDAGSNPALKRYLETNLKLLDLSDKLDVTYLRRLNYLIFDKARTEEMNAALEKTNQALTKLTPTYQFNLQAVTQLTAAERLRLPLIIDETNRLGLMLQASKAVVNEFMLGELPARRRIQLEYQRQIDLATREINAYRQLEEQHRITRAEMEAAEVQYTELTASLALQREQALQRETMAQISSTVQAGASLLATLGYRRAAAIVEAVWETAAGFGALARYDFWSAGQHFISAATYGVIAGQSGRQGVAGPAAGSYTGGTASGTAAGASRASSAAAERRPVINVYLDGKPLSKNTLDEIIYQVSDRVESSGVRLYSSVSGRVEAKS